MSDQQPSLSGKVVVIALAAAVGGFLFGFDTAVINGAVDALSSAESGFGLGPTLTGVAVSGVLLGCMAGAFYAGRLADKWGRVRVMIIAAVLFAGSSILSGLAFTVWDFIVWRLVGGVGVGIASVVVPAYIAEVAPANARGRLGSLQQLAIAFGIFAAFLSNAGIASIAGSAEAALWFGVEAWRWMLIAEVLPALVYGILALTLPESPRFLAAAGRDEDARRVLAAIGETDTDLRLAEIKESLKGDHRPSFGDLRQPGGGLKPVVWVAIAVALFQQTTGINIILYYGSSLWNLVGFGAATAMVIPIGTSILGITMTLVAIATVDRFGRRPLLLIGSAGMATSLGIVAVAFSNGVEGPDGLELSTGWAYTGLIAAHAFYIFFCGTWGPVMWVMLSEIFPNRLRGAGMAVAVAVNWLANFLVALTFPVLVDAIGLSLTYGLYAILTAVSFFYVRSRVPETRGRTLEEMTEEATPTQAKKA